MTPETALQVLQSVLTQASFTGTFAQINTAAIQAQSALQVLGEATRKESEKQNSE